MLEEAVRLYRDKDYIGCLELLYKQDKQTKLIIWGLILASYILVALSSYLSFVAFDNWNVGVAIAAAVVAVVVGVAGVVAGVGVVVGVAGVVAVGVAAAIAAIAAAIAAGVGGVAVGVAVGVGVIVAGVAGVVAAIVVAILPIERWICRYRLKKLGAFLLPIEPEKNYIDEKVRIEV